MGKSARLVIVCPSAIGLNNYINRVILPDNCANRMHGGDKEDKRPKFNDDRLTQKSRMSPCMMLGTFGYGLKLLHPGAECTAALLVHTKLDHLICTADESNLLFIVSGPGKINDCVIHGSQKGLTVLPYTFIITSSITQIEQRQTEEAMSKTCRNITEK